MTTVKLNFNNEVENKKIFEPVNKENNTGIVRNMEDNKKEWVNGGAGGVPGTDSNIEINTYPQVDDSKSNYSEASNIVNYEINETQKQIVKEQGNIETFSISVLINKGTLKGDSLANLDELKNEVKDLVKFATQGLSMQVSPIDENIHIQIMDFDTTLKDQVENAMMEEAKQKRNQMLIMLGSAVAALLIFASALIVLLKRRKDAKREEDIGIALSKIEEASEISDIEIEDKNELKKKVEKFVMQKPEQVAQLLKTWLNEE
jgi:flagellar M-ring protein FliF